MLKSEQCVFVCAVVYILQINTHIFMRMHTDSFIDSSIRMKEILREIWKIQKFNKRNVRINMK